MCSAVCLCPESRRIFSIIRLFFVLYKPWCLFLWRYVSIYEINSCTCYFYQNGSWEFIKWKLEEGYGRYQECGGFHTCCCVEVFMDKTFEIRFLLLEVMFETQRTYIPSLNQIERFYTRGILVPFKLWPTHLERMEHIEWIVILLVIWAYRYFSSTCTFKPTIWWYI